MRVSIRRLDERGVALGITIFAMMIIGALVGASFYIGVQEQRIGHNTVKLQQAFAAADGGAAEILTQWNTATYNALANGGSVAVGYTPLSGGAGWYRGSVRRLNN